MKESEAKEKEKPQRLAWRPDICDRCGSINTFRVIGRWRNVAYLRCSACGRRATRLEGER